MMPAKQTPLIQRSAARLVNQPSANRRRSFLDPSDAQLRYLSQSVRLDEAVSPHLVRLTAMIISLSVLGFLIWAAITNVNEVARSPGEIAPQGLEQFVQHVDGGTVREIPVREGQLVEKGDLLIRLDGIGTSEDLSRAEIKGRSLEAQAERLRALVENRAPDFAQFDDSSPAGVQEQQAVFNAMVRAQQQQQQIVQQQIRQKEKDNAVLKIRLRSALETKATLRDLADRYSTLHERGHISYIRMAETRQKLNDTTRRAEALAEQIKQSQIATEEFRDRLNLLQSSRRSEAYDELDRVESELAQHRETIRKLTRRMDRLMIRAPTRGIVKQISVNTIGGVVQPGQPLLTLLPLDDRLVVQTRIAPKDVGHVVVGQKAQIKVSAYDVARYGSIEGHVDFISATTFADDNGAKFYRGRVLLDRLYVGAEESKNQILPGMTVMVEIITGEKTILEYLLKPIRRAVGAAFSER